MKKTELNAKLSKETDPEEKKNIKKQIKLQDDILTTKASELQERLEGLEATTEGKIIADTVLGARQKALDKKIEDNNAKKSKPQIKNITISKLVEKNTQKKTEKENIVEDNTESYNSPHAALVSKLSKWGKKVYDKVCEVIDNESTLTPSYVESLKLKILKKLAR